MRRRNFLAGAATLGVCPRSLAQTGGGAMRRIGVLGNNPPSLQAPLWAVELQDEIAALKAQIAIVVPPPRHACEIGIGGGGISVQ